MLAENLGRLRVCEQSELVVGAINQERVATIQEDSTRSSLAREIGGSESERIKCREADVLLLAVSIVVRDTEFNISRLFLGHRERDTQQPLIEVQPARLGARRWL